MENDNVEYDFGERKFNFCDKVDLHSLDNCSSLSEVCSVASEHGFRGIMVSSGRIKSLVKEIDKIDALDRIIPICSIDWPYGVSSLNIRVFSVRSAKEDGAKEVEIVLPYSVVFQKNIPKINEDVETIAETCKKLDMGLKYCIDYTNAFVDDDLRNKISKILNLNNIQAISMQEGVFSHNVKNDNILSMRNYKAKSQCKIKAGVFTSNPEDISLYCKAGVDYLGIPWKSAPYLIHAYEDIIEKNQNNTN